MNKKTKNRRQALNQACFPSEIWFRRLLKEEEIRGFLRNYPLLHGRYYGDFVFLDLGLVVEIDGSSHDSPEAKAYDKKRDAAISDLGFIVRRVEYKDYRTARALLAEIKTMPRNPKNPNKPRQLGFRRALGLPRLPAHLKATTPEKYFALRDRLRLELVDKLKYILSQCLTTSTQLPSSAPTQSSAQATTSVPTASSMTTSKSETTIIFTAIAPLAQKPSTKTFLRKKTA